MSDTVAASADEVEPLSCNFLKGEKFQVVDEIRKLAYEKADISVTMLPIVKYIRDAR